MGMDAIILYQLFYGGFEKSKFLSLFFYEILKSAEPIKMQP